MVGDLSCLTKGVLPMHGFYRIATAINQTTIANPQSNAKEIITLLHQAYKQEVSVVVFPELTLTGYTASDLFLQQTLYQSQHEAFAKILKESQNISTVGVIGVAIMDANRLYNCAVVIQLGEVLGVVPKSYLPNNREFYEKRQFRSGKDIRNASIEFMGDEVPFGVDLLFGRGETLVFGVEICEDLWAVTPPSSALASSGATLIVNLSASNELIGKAQYRESLVRSQSARGMCAYAYSSSGVGESTTDTIFGGDALICEYGSLLARSKRFAMSNQLITADVDLQKLVWLRLSEGSFGDGECSRVRRVPIAPPPALRLLDRFVDAHPFVPSNLEEKAHRCEEIVNIQAHSLIQRMQRAYIEKAHIGISGGLDSSLALLSTHRAFEIMGWDFKDIVAVTMPGFGTTTRTKTNATLLCEALGVTLKSIDITQLSLETFEAIGHHQEVLDVTYENVQARARTSLLMNMANKEGGLVIGTGDLSEIALGWSTYNGDHMSMYALNASIPKTLIQYVIEYFTSNQAIASILHDILDTPISPELLPHQGDQIAQETESIIGPYELHDFFLYHIIKYGAKPSKVLYLADIAFDTYERATIKKWLIVFINRFFTQQFKRSCMPDGPKVGTISLSPRADWKMPSDANRRAWLEELERI